MMKMTRDDTERLNNLADKALNEVASGNELKEYNQLLTQWNDSAELNLFCRHHGLPLTPKLLQ